jgi:hypothetical protein
MDADSPTTHLLHGMRLVNRRTGEYTGACPHCQAGTNRYHVWTQPSAHGRPAWRYWCRSCGASGVLGAASQDCVPVQERPRTALLPRPADPCAAHIPFYRQLYELTALWAHGWLLDTANPDPLAALARRGVSAATARRHLLGYALRDPQALVAFLTEHVPDLMPYAQEAGLMVVDHQGILRTHWNLCGALLFPTMAEGEIIDLRARKLGVGAKARSLAGSPRERGAIYPFGWDDIGDTDTVLLQATHWWRDAGVVVLDEFDPSQLTRMIQLTSADLAAMARASCSSHAKAIVRWLAQVLATTTERSLAGALLYQELDAAAEAEGLSFAATLRQAVDALGAADRQLGLSQLPTNATLADYKALPPGYLPTLLRLLDREQRKRLIGQRFTSRIESRNGYLLLYLRLDHVIEQLACPEQPKIILDGTANRTLLEAIFPNTPIRVEQPKLAGTNRVIQVIGQDWAKTTLQGQRLERWYDAIAERIRPDRPTLIVTTLEWEAEVRLALAQRGHSPGLVHVHHYGGLRGSNAYKGFDVLLAQVYHPNLEQTIRTARALFADDPRPLDERIRVEERTLTDATGASWCIQVPTAADPRVAALTDGGASRGRDGTGRLARQAAGASPSANHHLLQPAAAGTSTNDHLCGDELAKEQHRPRTRNDRGAACGSPAAA